MKDPNEALAEASRAQDARAASTKKAAAKKQAARYTRTHALRDALAKGSTRAEVAEEVDRLYARKGGQSNPSGAKAMVDLHVPVLIAFGAVVKDAEGKLTLKQ